MGILCRPRTLFRRGYPDHGLTAKIAPRDSQIFAEVRDSELFWAARVLTTDVSFDHIIDSLILYTLECGAVTWYVVQLCI